MRSLVYVNIMDNNRLNLALETESRISRWSNVFSVALYTGSSWVVISAQEFRSELSSLYAYGNWECRSECFLLIPNLSFCHELDCARRLGRLYSSYAEGFSLYTPAEARSMVSSVWEKILFIEYTYLNSFYKFSSLCPLH